MEYGNEPSRDYISSVRWNDTLGGILQLRGRDLNNVYEFSFLQITSKFLLLAKTSGSVLLKYVQKDDQNLVFSTEKVSIHGESWTLFWLTSRVVAVSICCLFNKELLCRIGLRVYVFDRFSVFRDSFCNVQERKTVLEWSEHIIPRINENEFGINLLSWTMKYSAIST